MPSCFPLSWNNFERWVGLFLPTRQSHRGPRELRIPRAECQISPCSFPVLLAWTTKPHPSRKECLPAINLPSHLLGGTSPPLPAQIQTLSCRTRIPLGPPESPLGFSSYTNILLTDRTFHVSCPSSQFWQRRPICVREIKQLKGSLLSETEWRPDGFDITA